MRCSAQAWVRRHLSSHCVPSCRAPGSEGQEDWEGVGAVQKQTVKLSKSQTVAWSCHLLQASGRAPAPRDDLPGPQPRLQGPQAGTACWAKLYFRACSGVCWRVGRRCSVLFLPGGTRASMRSRHWKRPGLSQATPFCLPLLRGLRQMLSAIMPQCPPQAQLWSIGLFPRGTPCPLPLTPKLSTPLLLPCA